MMASRISWSSCSCLYLSAESPDMHRSCSSPAQSPPHQDKTFQGHQSVAALTTAHSAGCPNSTSNSAGCCRCRFSGASLTHSLHHLDATQVAGLSTPCFFLSISCFFEPPLSPPKPCVPPGAHVHPSPRRPPNPLAQSLISSPVGPHLRQPIVIWMFLFLFLGFDT